MYHTKRKWKHKLWWRKNRRELIFGENNITTGASNDIEKATKIIKDYVTKYGMSKKIGLLNMEVLFNNDSQGHLEEILISECSSHMERLYYETKELMIENKYFLNAIAEALLAQETINEEELNAIMDGTFQPKQDTPEQLESNNPIKLKPVIETL